jgi:hypothetical protein
VTKGDTSPVTRADIDGLTDLLLAITDLVVVIGEDVGRLVYESQVIPPLSTSTVSTVEGGKDV